MYCGTTIKLTVLCNLIQPQDVHVLALCKGALTKNLPGPETDKSEAEFTQHQRMYSL